MAQAIVQADDQRRVIRINGGPYRGVVYFLAFKPTKHFAGYRVITDKRPGATYDGKQGTPAAVKRQVKKLGLGGISYWRDNTPHSNMPWRLLRMHRVDHGEVVAGVNVTDVLTPVRPFLNEALRAADGDEPTAFEFVDSPVQIVRSRIYVRALALGQLIYSEHPYTRHHDSTAHDRTLIQMMGKPGKACANAAVALYEMYPDLERRARVPFSAVRKSVRELAHGLDLGSFYFGQAESDDVDSALYRQGVKAGAEKVIEGLVAAGAETTDSTQDMFVEDIVERGRRLKTFCEREAEAGIAFPSKTVSVGELGIGLQAAMMPALS